MGTFFEKKEDADRNRQWHVVDAAGIPLGRLATRVAELLRGKHKPTFTPHVDTGDFVVVINAKDVALSGAKASKKVYYHHTGYVGGLKEVSFKRMIEETPERVIEKAVKGMLPSGPLGRKTFAKLKVYGGAEHPHSAQTPQKFEIAL